MPWPKTGARLPDKGRAIKRLVVCNSWDLEPWDLLNGQALGCYQPSPEVGLVRCTADSETYLVNFSI